MIKQIPNIITLLNLLSGCIAITMAFMGNFGAVIIWVLIAAVFDFFDGMSARLLKAYSPLGKELDSLADVVSFGVAPATALFIIMRDYILLPSFLEPVSTYIPYIAFIIPMFAAYRLAKFNIDERQTTSFLGLPTPANGLFWIAYCYEMQHIAGINFYIFWLTLILILTMSWLMISEIPMFSLKVKNIGIKGNERQFLLLILIIAFIAIWGIIGISFGIIAYITISVITQNRAKQRVK